jgi:hypothetical protein
MNTSIGTPAKATGLPRTIADWNQRVGGSSPGSSTKQQVSCLKPAILPEGRPEARPSLASIKAEQNGDKKEAGKPPSLLSTHHQKRHGDRRLATLSQTSHDQRKRILPLP